MPQDLTRRAFLARSAALGCSAAASPVLTPVSFASAPWDNRLVVLILRGAMDGLDAVRPVGDRDFAALRPDRMDGGVALDGFHALHPALAPLAPLWQAGEMGIVNAVSTPYRDRRSHFDGQDILEAGTEGTDGIRDGWLNRMLQSVPGVEARTTFAIGQTGMLLAAGPAPVSTWSPNTALTLSPQTEHLLEGVTHEDPLFRDALSQAVELARAGQGGMPGGDMAGDTMTGEEEDSPRAMALQELRAATRAANRSGGYGELAAYAAGRLRDDSRIATFSINGWDTHARQDRAIRTPLTNLAEVITVLRRDLGPIWDRTAVLAMTEFGRTAWLNGSGGTDHGTAGTMLFAGGALRGGMAHGAWPGLAEADLYERRDLMPTSDVRTQAARVMQGLFGLDRAVLEGSIFPGLDMGKPSGAGLVL